MEKKKENPKEFEGYQFKGTGLTTAEKHWAESQFDEYRRHYHLESLSDLKLLEELVYREAFQERYKKKIGKLVKKLKKDSKEIISEDEIVPKHILDALNKNLEQILILKDKLGLFEEKKGDEYKAFEVLEKKMQVWKEEHIEEREIVCPFCSEIFFLNIRTDKYIPSKLKLFKNKILCNEELWKLYKKEGKITKDDVAKVLNVSPDYIDFLENKLFTDPSK